MGQVTLYDRNGKAVAYLDSSDEETIFSFQGEPLAYLDKSDNLYTFSGKYLGWFEDGIVWDPNGDAVGFNESKSPEFTDFEPFKDFKRIKPFKGFREQSPFRPFKSYKSSNRNFSEFLRGR